MKRRMLSRGGSRRLFRATAAKIHRKNIRPAIQRGGTRL